MCTVLSIPLTADKDLDHLNALLLNSIRFHIARRTGRVISLKSTLLLIDSNILGGREINLNKRQKMWKIYWLVQHSDFTELHSWEFYESYKILNTEMFPNVSLQIYCPYIALFCFGDNIVLLIKFLTRAWHFGCSLLFNYFLWHLGINKNTNMQ